MVSTSRQRSSSSGSSRRGTSRATADSSKTPISRRRRPGPQSRAKMRQNTSPNSSFRTSSQRKSLAPAQSPQPRSKRLGSGSSSVSSRRQIPGQGPKHAVVAGLIVIICVASFALALFILSYTPAFEIAGIEAKATSHLTSEAIGKLCDVPSGTTLLNVDTDSVSQSVKRNPWVKSVKISRSFPSTLTVSVEEQTVKAIVLMGQGNVAWYLSDMGTWIEPIMVDSESDTSASDQVLDMAQDLGCYLILEVPPTVQPKAGAKVTDASILCALEYMENFSDDFKSRIVSFTAPGPDSVSCTLDSGVEVSLGAAFDIQTKEAVINKILEEHPNQITYINVRTPRNPTYRRLSSDNVQPGSGAYKPQEKS